MKIVINSFIALMLMILLSVAVVFTVPTFANAEQDGTVQNDTQEEINEVEDESDSHDDSSGDSSSVTGLLAVLQSLMAQVEDLRSQLAAIRGEIRDIIKDDLREGMDHDDIKKIQKVLASDRSIYPEGLTTGYFGPLTRAALERFQTKFDLEVTGKIDEETKAALETLIEQGDVPAGLLRAPGLREKFERRLKIDCDKDYKKGVFCKKIKVKYKFDYDDHDHADEDWDDDRFDAEVDIKDDGRVKVSFKFGGVEYDVELNSSNQSDVLAAVAEIMGVDEIDADLSVAITNELADELSSENEDDDSYGEDDDDHNDDDDYEDDDDDDDEDDDDDD